jgi:hypothetical protein
MTKQECINKLWSIGLKDWTMDSYGDIVIPRHCNTSENFNEALRILMQEAGVVVHYRNGRLTTNIYQLA